MGISINDIGNEINKAAANVSKAATAAGAAIEGGAAKVANYAEGTLDKLYEGGIRGGALAARLIRFEGDVLANAIDTVRDVRNDVSATATQIFGDVAGATFDAGTQVGASFGGLFGDIIKEKQTQIGALKDLLLGSNPKLDKLDLFDVFSAKDNGLLDKMPTANLKGLLDKIRDLLGNNPFESIPTRPPVQILPFPKPFPGVVKPFPGVIKPLPFPQPNPLAGVVQMLRDVILALVEALKQRGAEQPGQVGTQPGQGGTAPTSPSTGGTGGVGTPGKSAATGDDFQDAILGQVQGVDDKINQLKEDLKKPGITAEESQRLMIELQDQLQLKRQLIEMLTNISKAFHDMAMAVIRNLAV